MHSIIKLYTIVLERALKYATSETRKEIIHLLIREFIDNHNQPGPEESERPADEAGE